MKKEYTRMDGVIIPISNDNIFTSDESQCIIITQLEDSDGSYSARCDVTPDEFIQREWFNNKKGQPVP